jgi:hypothetical protein
MKWVGIVKKVSSERTKAASKDDEWNRGKSRHKISKFGKIKTKKSRQLFKQQSQISKKTIPFDDGHKTARKANNKMNNKTIEIAIDDEHYL